MKFIKWLLKSIFFAFIIIFVVNFIGVYIGINIPVNIWTIIIVALFRVPGAIVLIIFFLI